MLVHRQSTTLLPCQVKQVLLALADGYPVLLAQPQSFTSPKSHPVLCAKTTNTVVKGTHIRHWLYPIPTQIVQHFTSFERTTNLHNHNRFFATACASLSFCNSTCHSISAIFMSTTKFHNCEDRHHLRHNLEQHCLGQTTVNVFIRLLHSHISTTLECVLRGKRMSFWPLHTLVFVRDKEAKQLLVREALSLRQLDARKLGTQS